MNLRDSYPKASAKPRKANGGEDLTFQLIDGNGNFNDEGLKTFAREVNLYQCGRSYAVVAIMGPQSSGKSTLLNHLFRTNFKMMDDSEGRIQTTRGIWLAKCPDIQPLTLVMDMEGTDGSERGEDDTAFEKQSALFALAVADVVLINMWCQDIGREHAANKPLLRTVFQQVIIQFSNKPRKITLMFVVRDKTKSPENILAGKLKEDIEKIWASVLKPSGSSNLQLHNFFKVEVVFLPNYEEREHDFKLKVKDLKQRFVHSTAPGGLADSGDQKEPASGFPMSAQKIWKDIMRNKDLDLPAQKIMVAIARCEEIKNEQYDYFQMNEELHNLRKDAQFRFIPDFWKRVNSMLNTYVSKYDAEALHFDEEVANEKREELIQQSLQLVEPVYQAMVNHLRLKHLAKFMEAFDKGSDEQNRFNTVADHIQYCLLEFDKDCAAIKVGRAKWDALKARAKLGRDMKSYAATKREDKPVSKVRRLYEPKLKQELSDSVGYLLCEEIDSTWSKIREHFIRVMDPTLSQLDNTLSELGVDEEGKKEMIEKILEYAKDIVGAKAREESGRAKDHMMRKFVKHFKYHDDSSPRDWNNSEEIQEIAEAALSTPLKLLAGLAAIRLEDGDTDDNIQDILFSALLGSGDRKALKDLDSPSWEKVPPSRTLITPILCKELWEAFRVEVKDAVNNAPELIQPEHQDMLNHLRLEYLNKFMEAFDKHSGEQKVSGGNFNNCINLEGSKEEDIIIVIDSDSEPVPTPPESKMTAQKCLKKKLESKGKSPSVTAVERGSAIASELTTGSQPLPTIPHSFGYPFNTFSSPIDVGLETDPNGSFWNQAVNYGNMIERTLLFPFDVEHHKQLTLAQRGQFMETIVLQLLSVMRIQNLECAHLLSRLSKVETSGKAKAEMETRIAKLHNELKGEQAFGQFVEDANAERKANKVLVDELNVLMAKLANTNDAVVELGGEKEILSREKAYAIKRFKSYWDGLEYGFWNGVNQAAYQAKLQYPGFEVDQTKLCKFKVLHKGQLMDPREVPEEEIDEEVDLAKGDDDLAFQLIDGNGDFKDMELNDFATEVNLYECGRSYAVVAIMGPQSSGKSTLLNHLFHTKFKEMDDSEGRSQTTQGIWLARCPDIKPLTLVMDIEGTDGSERGEDDTTFERRSALFALAVADVVLVNLWCNDIGREQATIKPLLRVVFQQVMLRFSNKPRKITLMFVVRDKTRSPEDKLAEKLRSDINKIWDSIKKTTESSNIPLSDFFKVEVVFLPNYGERESEFRLKVQDLKQRFVDSTAPGGLADSGEGKEPASGFAISAQNIWKDIKKNKDLNLPAHKILVATMRGEQISNEVYDTFETNEDWCNLRKEVLTGFVPDFGIRVNSILKYFLSKFDAEASYFDEAVTTGQRKDLVDKLLKLVQPVYQAILNHLRLQHLKKFMEAFDKSSDEQNMFATVADGSIKDCLHAFDKDCEVVRIELANWDTLKAKAKLRLDMNSYINSKREDKVASKIRRLYEPKLKQELSDSVGYLLCEETDPTWSKIRKRLKIVVQSTIPKVNTTLSEFGVDEEGRREKIQKLEEYAKEVVEAKAREESGRANGHMMKKFLTLFKTDRQWKSEEEIEAAARAALYTPLDMLAGLAAIRLEAGDTDNIHQILSTAFWGSGDPNTLNHLASPSWAEVPPSRTLLTPIQCIGFWKVYLYEANDAVKKAHEDFKKKRPRWLRFVLKALDVIISIPLEVRTWAVRNYS